MPKLTNKQYDRLIKLIDFANKEDLTLGDLQVLICDAGLCPVEHCVFYTLGDIICPHLTEVCLRLNSK